MVCGKYDIILQLYIRYFKVQYWNEVQPLGWGSLGGKSDAQITPGQNFPITFRKRDYMVQRDYVWHWLHRGRMKYKETVGFISTVYFPLQLPHTKTS